VPVTWCLRKSNYLSVIRMTLKTKFIAGVVIMLMRYCAIFMLCFRELISGETLLM
jgi:hypothetical protein